MVLFQLILKKLGIYIAEVRHTDFEKAEIWNSFDRLYKDAVMIYYVLKDHCYSVGDTYLSIHRLNGQTPRYKGYFISDYNQG